MSASIVRLNRYLASCGLGSRRGTEQFIAEGRIEVNRHVCLDPATVVGEDDEVRLDGARVSPAETISLLLHKPKGFICTRFDPEERQTIYHLVPPRYHSLHHVGRLDKESEGLIILTNDGDLSYNLTHPSRGVEKEYVVSVDKAVQDSHLPILTRGIETEEGMARAEKVERISARRIKVVLKQGLKRQIRLMFQELGYTVNRLIRVRIGTLEIDLLPSAATWRMLSRKETQHLLSVAEKNSKHSAKTKARAKTGKPAVEGEAVTSSVPTEPPLRVAATWSESKERFGFRPLSGPRPDETKPDAAVPQPDAEAAPRPYTRNKSTVRPARPDRNAKPSRSRQNARPSSGRKPSGKPFARRGPGRPGRKP